MKSHIQMPKCVFKEFAKDNNGFYKYNIQNSVINRGFPKSTFTEEGYYSDTMEKKLNRFVETPLKKLLDFARELPTQSLPIVLDGEIKDIALVFVKSLIARSPNLYSAVQKNSFFFQFASIQNQHDIIVNYAMSEKKMEELFDKFDISFMINETATPFVLPTRGIYEYQINDVLCMNVPLNTQCAIFLKEKGKTIHKSNYDEAEIAILPEGFDDVAMKINSYALQRQRQDGIGYVVSHDYATLSSLTIK